jgi:hypothetical protein
MPSSGQRRRRASFWGAAAGLALIGVIACGSSSGAATVAFTGAGGKRIKVEVADSPEKRTLGLMYRDSLAGDRGMWFIFSRDGELVFWMKNVRFPIDIIFIDGDYNIRTIWKSAPPCASEPCPTYPSGASVRYTLEVVSGFCERYGVKENQRVTYRP